MATTTLYGGAPLPPLAPAADGLEASRGVAGGWNAQQRTTRRTALGVALAFACAGFAALALVTSPAYGIARAERDGVSSRGAGTRAGVALASSEGFVEDAAASASPSAALGRADAAGLLRQFGDALPDAQHDRLAELMDAARVMPEATFARLRASAAAAATATDAKARGDATAALLNALGRVAGGVDELTASFVELFAADGVSEDTSEAALAVGVARLMDALRRFPAWTDDDCDAFERAAEGARAETWRRFESAEPVRFANLGDTETVVSSRTRIVGDAKDEREKYLKLNGVKPAASRGAFGGSEQPAPFSSLAAAPGLARASALGSRAAKTEKKTDTPWGVGARSDASTTRALRAAFDPESVGLPRAFDARVAFPKCAGVIGSVRDQGKCGSCWAVAATEVMNDRLCVVSGGRRRRELSPQYALSCFDAGAGCDGGDVLATLREAAARGVPYGGMGIETGDAAGDAKDGDAKDMLREALLGGRSRTKRTNSTTSVSKDGFQDVCVPYEFEPCDHPCQVPGTRAAKCPSTCADGSDLELVFPASEAYACPPGDWACIAREIHTFGSVAVTFGSVRADFYEHETGVYRVRDVTDPGLGQHATKLIGWGFDDARDDPYWIMMNSWRNWGENGAGRVGVGEMNIESGISAVRM